MTKEELGGRHQTRSPGTGERQSRMASTCCPMQPPDGCGM